MKKLSRIYIWGFVVLFASLNLTGQAQTRADEITVTTTPVGQYLEFPAMPLAGQMLTVERNDGQGFEVVAYIHPPASRDVFYHRLTENSFRLPVLQQFPRTLSDTIYSVYASGNLENFYADRTPAIQMALGRAFLDTLSAPRAYRATLGDQQWSAVAKDFQQPVPTIGRITIKEYKPDPQIQRAVWQLDEADYPTQIRAYRQKMGLDSAYSEFDAVIGMERDSIDASKMNLYLSDTTVFQSIVYHYHLKGFDVLGNVVSLSDTLRMGASERALGQFNLQAGPTPENDGILLTWDRLEAQHAVRSIQIFRSHIYDGEYTRQTILPPGDTSWVDRSAGSGVNYYYQMVTQGNQEFSLESPRVFGKYDSQVLRADAPTIVTATVQDSAVNVSWTYKDYSDVYGFRVHRSAGLNGEFEPISDVLLFQMGYTDYYFLDEDKSLQEGEFYTYAVSALNRNHVETKRVASETVYIKRLAALTAPLEVRIIAMNDTTASISWREMSEENPGVIGYHVYRKPAVGGTDEPFVRLNEEMIGSGNEYVDVTAFGTAWQYVVQSVGVSDSSGYSLPVVFRSEAPKPLPPGRIRVYKQANGVMVDWDGTLNTSIAKYHIYRGSADGEPMRIGTVLTRDNTLSFVDKDAKTGNLYFYYITTENEYGIESDSSDELSIRL